MSTTAQAKAVRRRARKDRRYANARKAMKSQKMKVVSKGIRKGVL